MRRGDTSACAQILEETCDLRAGALSEGKTCACVGG